MASAIDGCPVQALIRLEGVSHSQLEADAGLPGLDAPAQYNPYLSSPPNYYGSQPIVASLLGPNQVSDASTNTWNATASYGTPPYSYQWSGMFSGTSASISGTVYQSGDLFLDIYDAAGQHFSASIYITDNGCSGGLLIC